MDNLGNQQIVHAGWLIKSPPEKRIWKTKWRRRWFILKPSGQIPGQYLLEYYTDTTCKKLKGQIDLDQCEQVDAGLQLEIRKQNYDNMFDLRTSKRTYYLVAISEDDMNKWVECICSVCGLKMETLQNDLSLTLPSIEFNPNTDTTTTNNNNNGSQSSTNNSPNHNLNINANNTNSVSTNLESYEELRYSPQPIQNDPNQLLSSTLQQQQSTSELSLSTLNYIPISECYTGKPLCKDKNDDHRNNECLSVSSPPPPRPPKPALLQQHHQNINHLLTSASKSQSSLALWPHDQQHQQQTMATEQPTIMPNAIGNAPQLSSGSSLHQMSGSVLSAQQPSPPPKSSPSTVLLNNINNNNNANIVGNRSFYLNSSVSSSSKQSNENKQSYNFYDTWHSRSKRPDFLHAPSSSLQQQQPNILIPPHVNRDLKPNRRRILPEQQQHSNSQENQKNLKQINYFQPKTNKSDSNVSMKMMIMNDTNYNHTDNNNNNNNLHQQYSANKQPFRRINTNSTQPNITSRHTLPRPLITSYTLRNNQNKDNYSHSTHCEQPKTTIEDCERQYLDLDLDIESTNSTNNNHNNLSTSPKTNDHHPSSSSTISDQNNIPDNQSDSLMNNNNNCDQSNSTHLTTDFADNPGTVYKEVDFLKTKALNEMRLNRNIYRKAN